jgi:copper(I)-binding protein
MKKISQKVSFATIWVAILLSACSPKQEGILVHNTWVRPVAQGENASVYFVLFNHTSETDLLTSVSTAVAEATELDESTLNGEVVQMTPLEYVLVPASTEVDFRSGGLHVMLLGLKQDLKLNSEIEISLHFLHYPDLIVKVPVRNFPEPDSEVHH